MEHREILRRLDEAIDAMPALKASRDYQEGCYWNDVDADLLPKALRALREIAEIHRPEIDKSLDGERILFCIEGGRWPCNTTRASGLLAREIQALLDAEREKAREECADLVHGQRCIGVMRDHALDCARCRALDYVETAIRRGDRGRK